MLITHKKPATNQCNWSLLLFISYSYRYEVTDIRRAFRFYLITLRRADIEDCTANKKRLWLDGLFSQIKKLSPPFVYANT